MRKTSGILTSAAAALALAAGLALGPAPVATAASTQIDATGGDHTAVDRDGTQGSFTDSVQGKVDSDGDQDAFDLTKSEEAKPPMKAKK